ncbi:unnamed protein product [Schistosoma mattheei]|uniref:Tudor domain-containing protein n=1 Tax=Schistosoma mattheei TaxID=31246 RepID=A0AA85BU97_9TREM|nr:unnamed protein product [Schistosoma mattheei]
MLQCLDSQKVAADADMEARSVPDISEASNSDGTSQTSVRTLTRTRCKKLGSESSLVSGLPKIKPASQTRKSMRSRVLSNRSRGLYGNYNGKGTAQKSRSRRHVLKRETQKLGNPPALISLRNCVYHENVWYHVGDIVSLLDVDGEVFYAQIRGNKSLLICCFLTWLIPTSGCRDEEFRPSDYIIGMEEDVLRDLRCCKLVCRCPSDYFQPIASPYTIQSFK